MGIKVSVGSHHLWASGKESVSCLFKLLKTACLPAFVHNPLLFIIRPAMLHLSNCYPYSHLPLTRTRKSVPLERIVSLRLWFDCAQVVNPSYSRVISVLTLITSVKSPLPDKETVTGPLLYLPPHCPHHIPFIHSLRCFVRKQESAPSPCRCPGWSSAHFISTTSRW